MCYFFAEKRQNPQKVIGKQSEKEKNARREDNLKIHEMKGKR